ncbi:MAG: glucuronate isomerase [Planctomycetaceae bacterium]
MSSTRQTILQALRDIRLIDPHSHINPHQPASTTLADILGYHYYTELVHSAGMPKSEIESSSLSPRELVHRLIQGLPHLTNTAQHAWLIDICQRFFGFEGDAIDESNWQALYDSAEANMQVADWADSVLEKSNVEAVFLTNEFDDDLEGFDTKVYIPCLRTDDLVFHFSKKEVRDRLAVCTGIGMDGSLKSLRDSLEQRFEHFVSRGARACAISLPPDFSPTSVSDGRAATALDAVLRSAQAADPSHKAALAKRVFWTIVELCDEYRLPMDLMIGVNRGVYENGVYQGRDLYDSRVSLVQYRELFNAFPEVKFPISVLASVTNQELVSHAWIFPNVITNGHWWYSNTPSFIRRDAAARLEAVPRNKQIGYYSDAYKLEFIAPKFDMYRRILAGILTDDFVIERGWSEEQAIDLGRQILRGNVDTVFPDLSDTSAGRRDGQGAAGLYAGTERLGSIVSEELLSVGDPLLPDDLADAQSTEPSEVTNFDTDFTGQEALGNASPEGNAVADASPADEDWSHSTIIEWAPDQAAARQSGSPSDASADATELSTGAGAETGSDQAEAPWALAEENRAAEADELQLEFEDAGDFEDGGQSDSLDPNATIEQMPAFADGQASDQESDIRYFRADDDPFSSEPVEPKPEPPTAGLYADPTTGELTWPVETPDESSPSVDESYLLPMEPAPHAGVAESTAQLDELELEDLELAPLEEDLEPLQFPNDEADDLQISDSGPIADLDRDEPRH